MPESHRFRAGGCEYPSTGSTLSHQWLSVTRGIQALLKDGCRLSRALKRQSFSRKWAKLTQDGRTPLSATTSPILQTTLANRFRAARRQTINLCEPLTPEDMMVQSCPEASPAKWHLAHTTWFFESFVLREFLPDYRVFNADFAWLFNSYYESFSAFPEKRLRSSFSRPGARRGAALPRACGRGNGASAGAGAGARKRCAASSWA